ncbi:hypothetical protein ES332_A01G092100v1 [Gossypium tomentosum]|uniref:Uncharacterized protein n=1 Tax=Gossypium tomentosum TaxID=34277 RepID=A0A5D2RRB6_GOSTO|nr:hypothetical protein ES332_A01G092100v1 [Gossypium tomentosum]
MFPKIIVPPKPQNFPKSNPFAVSLSLFNRQQAERLRDFILKSNSVEGYLWRVHQIKHIIMTSVSDQLLAGWKRRKMGLSICTS